MTFGTFRVDFQVVVRRQHTIGVEGEDGIGQRRDESDVEIQTEKDSVRPEVADKDPAEHQTSRRTSSEN